MDSLHDLLRKKADDIGSDGVSDDLKIIQNELDRHFSGKAKANKFDSQGVLMISSSSSSIASEVRIKAYQLMDNLKHSTKNPISRIRVRIN